MAKWADHIIIQTLADVMNLKIHIMQSDNYFRDMGFLPFTRENRKFQLEDQMVRAIPFGKLQKIWAFICGDAIFLLF